MLIKVVSGDRRRRSRLHDEKGNFVGWEKALKHGPRALVTGLLRLSFGYRPVQPWISYDAIERLTAFLQPESRVLEFGSGMSTVWYASHAAEVCSVEDCRPWYDKVKALLARRGLLNVHYQLAEDPDAYASYMADDPAGFDLVMVDGSSRASCMRNAVQRVRAGGILYLDNSDKHSTPAGGDTREAEERALALARERGAEVTYFTDFAPTQLFVQQGLMVRLPRGPGGDVPR